MTDTLWADVSEWNPPVTDAYPYGLFCFRCNDGTYLDGNYRQNMAWAKTASPPGGSGA